MNIKILNYPEKYKDIIYEAGRNCYGVNNEITTTVQKVKFIDNLIKNNHTSVLEHIHITILISDIPRSLMEQLTRHRLCSFSIKSTHYLDHSLFNYHDFEELGNQYKQLMLRIRNLYQYYTETLNIPHYIAREILPNSCLTNIVMTTNIREYRLILQQRLTKNNVPIMVELMRSLARNLYLICPECFIDIIEEHDIE
jgi:thymidylate synthase (FAD)